MVGAWYNDIYKVISNILEKKFTQEYFTNYLKHSYKIYKSLLYFVSFFFLVSVTFMLLQIFQSILLFRWSVALTRTTIASVAF